MELQVDGKLTTEDCDDATTAIACCAPVGPPGFQYVGSTGVTPGGDFGVATANDMCNTLQAGAVFCTSRMIHESPSALPPVDSWVHPDEITFFGTATGFGPTAAARVMDYSGVPATTAAELNCSGWRQSFNAGLILNTAGQLATGNCSVGKAIACCAQP